VVALLRIDEHLLAAAAGASTCQDVEAGSASEMSRWLATVPDDGQGRVAAPGRPW
jgi:hypothetical protein